MTALAAVPALDCVISDEEAWTMWEAEMRAQGLRERTLEHRRQVLFQTLAGFVGKPLVTLQRTDLIRFLGQAHFTAATRQNYRCAIRLFYTLLQDEGYRLDNPAARLPKVRMTRPEPLPFTTSEIQQLLNSGIYARARMMVLLAAYQGFRAVEIAAVRGENIRWDDRMILTAEAKNGHEVWRPIHPLVWAEAQKFPRAGYWFPARVGKDNKAIDYTRHVLPNSVSRTIGDAIKRAGLGHHRGHQLRAWHATELLDAGADTMTVQFSMRHASQNTLQRYIKPNQTRILDAMSRLPEVQVPQKSQRRPREAAAR